MLTPYSHKHTALRAVHLAGDEGNIGVVLRPNVNRCYRFDFLPAVVCVKNIHVMLTVHACLLAYLPWLSQPYENYANFFLIMKILPRSSHLASARVIDTFFSPQSTEYL